LLVVHAGLAAADGIAQQRPGPVRPHRRRAVAQHTGEQVRVAADPAVLDAVGGPFRAVGERPEGSAQVP